MLSRAGVGPGPGLGLALAQRLGNVRRVGRTEGRQVRAGKADLAAGVQKLHFQLVTRLVTRHQGAGVFIIAVLRQKVAEALYRILRLLGQRLAEGGIVIASHGGGEGRHRQQDNKQHHADGVYHPALADPADAFDLLHMLSSHHLGFLRVFGQIRSPTCTRSPTPS